MINLAASIPLRARRVLELGCGSGDTGRSFLSRQPMAEFWGVTEDEQQAERAAEHLSHVLCLAPGEVTGEKLRKRGLFGRLDAIVVHGAYGKALAGRLQELAGMLAEDGQLLIAFGNGGYLQRALASAAGVFLPEEEEALPREQVRKMAEAAGLQVYAVDAMRPGGERGQQDRELAGSPEGKALLQALQGILGKRYPGAQADVLTTHYVMRTGREEQAQPKLAVHAMEGEAMVTARVRVEEPLGALSAEPGVEANWEPGTLNARLDAGCEAKICLVQRLSFGSLAESEKKVQWLREHGYLVVHEMDDNPSLWKERNEQNRWADFRLAHAIQVSTEALAEVMRQYNPEVKVFRNELLELPPQRNYAVEMLRKLNEDKTDYATVFFGALNRDREWQDIMPALNEAAKRYGSKLRFKVLADKAFFEALETEHKEFVGSDDYYQGRYVPYQVYASTLHQADIALLPLHDNEFNRTKSDLKFIESAGHGAVVLASPLVYEETVRDGRTGFLYRNPQEFADRLALLVEDRERRLEVAAAAYEYVKKERLLCHHYAKRLQWYRSLWERRASLDSSLLHRLAELNKE